MNRNILIISIIAVVAAVVLIVLLTRHHKNKDVSSQMLRDNNTNVIYLTSSNRTYNLTSEESGSTIIVFTEGLDNKSQLIINLPDIITNNLNGVHYKIMVFDDPENSQILNAILSAYPNSPSPITTTMIPYNKLTKKLKSQSEITLDEINLRSFYVVSYNGLWYVSI